MKYLALWSPGLRSFRVRPYILNVRSLSYNEAELKKSVGYKKTCNEFTSVDDLYRGI